MQGCRSPVKKLSLKRKFQQRNFYKEVWLIGQDLRSCGLGLQGFKELFLKKKRFTKRNFKESSNKSLPLHHFILAYF